MKSKVKFLVLLMLIVAVIALLSSCYADKKTDQEKLAEIIQERFTDIDQFSFDGRALSLDEAEAYLYCWVSGEEISDEELREAIWVVLESTDLIRDLIFEIDEIEIE